MRNRDNVSYEKKISWDIGSRAMRNVSKGIISFFSQFNGSIGPSISAIKLWDQLLPTDLAIGIERENGMVVASRISSPLRFRFSFSSPRVKGISRKLEEQKRRASLRVSFKNEISVHSTVQNVWVARFAICFFLSVGKEVKVYAGQNSLENYLRSLGNGSAQNHDALARLHCTGCSKNNDRLI